MFYLWHLKGLKIIIENKEHSFINESKQVQLKCTSQQQNKTQELIFTKLREWT